MGLMEAGRHFQSYLSVKDLLYEIIDNGIVPKENDETSPKERGWFSNDFLSTI